MLAVIQKDELDTGHAIEKATEGGPDEPSSAGDQDSLSAERFNGCRQQWSIGRSEKTLPGFDS
jgi:hypothetical protein